MIKATAPGIAESEVLTMQTRHSFSSFSSLSNALLLFCSAAIAACSGEVVPIGEHDGKLSAAADDDGAGGVALPACEAPSGPTHEYTSIADAEARVAGTWLLCSGAITSPADTAGIELSPGKARFLQKSGNTLAPGPGWDYERNVTIIDTTSTIGPGSYQMNLSSAGGFLPYFSRTSEDGRFLELNEGTSGKRSRYVRVPPKQPACGVTGAAHAYTSVADVAARIAGRWAICSGGVTSPADTRGLEIAGADAWFLVDASGALVRGPDWDYERSVEILDTTAVNGPGSYQIDLSTGAGKNMYHSRMSETGDVLELSEATSGKKVVYRRIP